MLYSGLLFSNVLKYITVILKAGTRMNGSEGLVFSFTKRRLVFAKKSIKAHLPQSNIDIVRAARKD